MTHKKHKQLYSVLQRLRSHQQDPRWEEFKTLVQDRANQDNLGAISRLEYQLGNQASLERIAIQNEMHRMFKEGMLSVLTLVDRELIETKRLLNLPINEDEFES